MMSHHVAHCPTRYPLSQLTGIILSDGGVKGQVATSSRSAGPARLLDVATASPWLDVLLTMLWSSHSAWLWLRACLARGAAWTVPAAAAAGTAAACGPCSLLERRHMELHNEFMLRRGRAVQAERPGPAVHLREQVDHEPLLVSPQRTATVLRWPQSVACELPLLLWVPRAPFCASSGRDRKSLQLGSQVPLRQTQSVHLQQWRPPLADALRCRISFTLRVCKEEKKTEKSLAAAAAAASSSKQ